MTTHLIRFVGKLRAADGDADLLVTDDVGNMIALPNAVRNFQESNVLEHYVEVTGSPEYARDGRLVRIHNAVITSPETIANLPSRVSSDLATLLAKTPGSNPGGIPDLTTDEASEFLQAVRR